MTCGREEQQLTAPTDQRRSFDTAIERFKAGDTRGALAGFVAITASQPTMSDAWLGRVACGDHAIDVLEAAHRNSRSLYRETRRIGLVDGDLHARLDAPLYVTMPVWSRSTIALAYATRADRRPAVRRGGRRARRSRRRRRRDGRAVGAVRRRGRLPPGAAVAGRPEDHRQVAARARHPRRRRPDRRRRHARRGGRRQHRAVSDRAGSRQHRHDEEPVHRRRRRADQGLVPARTGPGGRRTGVVRAGDQQRRAARRRCGGPGQSRLPVDRHRRPRPSPPAPTRGIPAPRRPRRSARPRRWRSRRTRCSPRRSGSWTS